MEAILSGHEAEVESLLSEGARVDTSNPDELQPLHQSLILGQSGITSLLLRFGASIHAVDSHHWSALHFAAQYKGPALELLARGADVAAQNDLGETALHLAIRSQETRTISHLLRRHASPNILSEEGMTPFHLLLPLSMPHNQGWLDRPTDYCSTVSQFVKFGASVTEPLSSGETPVQTFMDALYLLGNQSKFPLGSNFKEAASLALNDLLSNGADCTVFVPGAQGTIVEGVFKSASSRWPRTDCPFWAQHQFWELAVTICNNIPLEFEITGHGTLLHFICDKLWEREYGSALRSRRMKKMYVYPS